MTDEHSLPTHDVKDRAPTTLGGHLKATLTLGLPLVIMQIMQMLINVTDTVMLGWLGVEPLAAGVLAFQTLFIVYIFGLGFSAALMPLVAGALGRDDAQSVRRSTRMGLWVLLIVVLLFMVPLSYGEEMLILLGQDPELAALADTYLVIAKFSLIPAFLATGLRNFLASLEHTAAIVWVTLGTVVLNALLNYGFIFGNFGLPRLEMEGAAYATCIANAAAFAALALYVRLSRVTKPYAIFQRLWRPDWPAFWEIVRIGLPISLTILAEAGLFSGASVLIGWIGTVELAAHGIALQLASIAFMVPLGLSQAGSVRVASAAGRQDSPGIGLAARACLALGLGFALFSAALFVLVPGAMVMPFLDEATPRANDVMTYAVSLLAAAAAFQIFDTLQVISIGNLRGLKDTQMPLIIAVISYWPIGMGTAYLLGIHLNYGAIGVWCGLVVGLAAAGFSLTWRFAQREKLGLV